MQTKTTANTMPVISDAAQSLIDATVQKYPQATATLDAFADYLDRHDLTYEQRETIDGLMLAIYTKCTAAAFLAGMNAIRKPELLLFRPGTEASTHRPRHRAQAEQ